MSGLLYTSYKAAALGLRIALRRAFPGMDFHVFAERIEGGSICFTVEYRHYDVLLEELKAAAESFVKCIYVPEDILNDEIKFIEPKYAVSDGGELINMSEQHTLLYRVI